MIQIPTNYSFFLFGPRGVGKSTLLKEKLPKETTYFIDLLDYGIESQLVQNPQIFAEWLEVLPPQIRWVVVDEIQKLPLLLDEVHRQLELHPQRLFALTGSSARKLKRGQANLLAGRAFTLTLQPLCMAELGETFDLQTSLSFGTLPKLLALTDVNSKEDFLRSYVQTYLQEEIQMEGLVRNLLAFRRFLPLAATANGEVLSWTRFAQDVGVDAKTIRSYFEILEDTLIGFLLPAYARSLRKRQKTHPKFYLFDPGVARALANRLNVPLLPGSPEYGRAFEHFWIVEIMRMNAYQKKDFQLSYFATTNTEIDLVIERPGLPLLFVEFKSTEHVRDQELRTLQGLTAEVKGSSGICICREKWRRKVGNVLVVPWQEALGELGFDAQ